MTKQRQQCGALNATSRDSSADWRVSHVTTSMSCSYYAPEWRCGFRLLFADCCEVVADVVINMVRSNAKKKAYFPHSGIGRVSREIRQERALEDDLFEPKIRFCRNSRDTGPFLKREKSVHFCIAIYYSCAKFQLLFH